MQRLISEALKMQNVKMTHVRSVSNERLYYQVCKSSQNIYELSQILLQH